MVRGVSRVGGTAELSEKSVICGSKEKAHSQDSPHLGPWADSAARIPTFIISIFLGTRSF